MSERIDSGAGPSLADALDVAIRDNALTLVAAPSGYGRSAAVGHWARRRPGTTRIRVAGAGSDTEQIARAIA